MSSSPTYPVRPPSRAYAEGWTASVLLHAAGLIGAILLTSNLQLAPQPTPFTWEIAMVEPAPRESQPVQQPEPVQKTEPVEQSQPVQQSEPVRQSEPQVTEPQPAVKEVQTRSIQPMQKPVKQQVREVRQAAPPVTRPADQPTQTVQTTRPAESVQTTNVETIASQPVTAQTYSVSTSPAPLHAQREISSTTPNVVEQTVSQSQSTPVSAKEPAVQSKPNITQVASAPQIMEQGIVEHNSAGPVEQAVAQTQAFPVTTGRTIQTRREATTATDTAPRTRQIVQGVDSSIKEISKAVTQEVDSSIKEVSKPVTQDIVTHNMKTPAHTSQSRQQAVTSHTQSSSQSRENYSWLAELLWNRIEQFKRYPAKARMRQWEGQVVLLAVITDSGEVTTVDVVKSSGYDVLDDNAIAALRRASPITLNQKMEISQVAVKIPINYRLGR